MLERLPNDGEIVSGARSTSGLILTVPAGRTWSGDIAISGCVTVAATGHPVVTVSGSGAMPPNGSIVADLTIVGLALTTVANANTIEAVVAAPEENSVDLVFSVGGASAASVVANGFLF